MNMVIFGTGDIYRRNKNYIAKDDNIVALLDNNKRIQGRRLDGIQIYDPSDIGGISYDRIILMSASYRAMREQLLELGCDSGDILYYPEYVSLAQAGKMEVYFGAPVNMSKKKALVITSSLGYHGGAMTAVYTAMALEQKGYAAVVAAPGGDRDFIEEFRDKGITFFICPSLPFARQSDLFWTKPFQMVVVNTYPMILCGLEISRYRKVVIWLHESHSVYQSMDFWRSRVLNEILSPNLRIYAVSDVAKRNFEKNIRECNTGILPCGIPDTGTEAYKINEKLRFAVIGTIHPIKCQLLFLDAVERLEESRRGESEFLIIGDQGNEPDYVNLVEAKAKRLTNVSILGRKTRREVEEIYGTIDVLVVASEQETMSLTAIEAMMHKKVCIVSDAAGMAGYIRHKENGLTFRVNDVNSLLEGMEFCIQNRDRLEHMGRRGRETYEAFFTLEKFGDRIQPKMAEWKLA